MKFKIGDKVDVYLNEDSELLQYTKKTIVDISESNNWALLDNGKWMLTESFTNSNDIPVFEVVYIDSQTGEKQTNFIPCGNVLMAINKVRTYSSINDIISIVKV